MDSQHSNILNVGLHHPSTLTTPLLLRLIGALILGDFFSHHSPRTYYELELHLRCIVASLRLLWAHGIQPGSGTIRFDCFDTLYNRMSWWQSYYEAEAQGAKAPEDKAKNYNNEFLIVYIRDLIASLPSDQTVTANATTRLFAAAATLGHTVFSRGCPLNASTR